MTCWLTHYFPWWLKLCSDRLWSAFQGQGLRTWVCLYSSCQDVACPYPGHVHDSFVTHGLTCSQHKAFCSWSLIVHHSWLMIWYSWFVLHGLTCSFMPMMFWLLDMFMTITCSCDLDTKYSTPVSWGCRRKDQVPPSRALTCWSWSWSWWHVDIIMCILLFCHEGSSCHVAMDWTCCHNPVTSCCHLVMIMWFLGLKLSSSCQCNSDLWPVINHETASSSIGSSTSTCCQCCAQSWGKEKTQGQRRSSWSCFVGRGRGQAGKSQQTWQGEVWINTQPVYLCNVSVFCRHDKRMRPSFGMSRMATDLHGHLRWAI